MKKISISFLLIAMSVAACKTTKVDPPEPAAKAAAVDCSKQYTYAFDIKPILEQYCTRCHGEAGGFDFTNFEDVKSAGQKGELVGTISYAHGFPHMPANSPKLDQVLIDKITCWVNQGMKP
jgi:mono/diheme cytochrome c family protein